MPLLTAAITSRPVTIALIVSVNPDSSWMPVSAPQTDMIAAVAHSSIIREYRRESLSSRSDRFMLVYIFFGV